MFVLGIPKLIWIYPLEYQLQRIEMALKNTSKYVDITDTNGILLSLK